MSRSQFDKQEFAELKAISSDEIVTHASVRDIQLGSGRILALVTLHSEGEGRPNTLWVNSLLELGRRLAGLKNRAALGEIQAVGVTGTARAFSAGADLSMMPSIESKEHALQLARLGHLALGQLSDLGVPSFAFINGNALGGGLELSLHADYRTVQTTAVLGLPEVGIGLVPGWGGAFLVPNLIGVQAGIDFIVTGPSKRRATVNPRQALQLGLVDASFPSTSFLEDSLQWADSVLEGSITVTRDHEPDSTERDGLWTSAVAAQRARLVNKIGNVPTAPYVALDLIERAQDGRREAAFEREDKTLADLMVGEQFTASLYAFNTVQAHSKRPTGAPPPDKARQVTKVGVIGAGLMARQFALLFATKLQVPVVISDLDRSRVVEGINQIHSEIDSMETKGRLDHDSANRVRGLVSGTTDLADYADCDFVIEAVFEETGVKQKVLSAAENVLAAGAVLATNTSSLSVTEIGTALRNPERLVGFHFFNPVSAMPLLEIVATPTTNAETLATAFSTARSLGKTAVLTSDAPGFVVNRLLAKVMGEAANAIDRGTPLQAVGRAFAPIALPMSPLHLMDLVGWKVAAHVQDTMNSAFPDRFYASENLHRLAEVDGEVLDRDPNGRIIGWTPAAQECLQTRTAPLEESEILERIQDGLAEEAKLMLDEGVVSEVEDLDLCLLLGAGWPYINGGITHYLDRVGASHRAFGATFHPHRAAVAAP